MKLYMIEKGDVFFWYGHFLYFFVQFLGSTAISEPLKCEGKQNFQRKPQFFRTDFRGASWNHTLESPWRASFRKDDFDKTREIQVGFRYLDVDFMILRIEQSHATLSIFPKPPYKNKDIHIEYF